MNRKVVVENTLEDVRRYLADHGYDVRTMYKDDTVEDIVTDEYDAIVVTDLNSGNVDRNLKVNVPVIEAAGLTPGEVYQKMTRGRRH
ncbi:YkuS family protein [Geosporobacter ferrireducens]|uniref:YkuS family protein n=1 Tax=Geosporobacter ferrireducens TaxID=1424294 RepID=A0A1D8GFK8_9FIRM|nr:YkuS family protein [Geosporobacter ferrireducens]AOT69686.1 hypothetical protein Gferi_08895 [Geosporobacter ferrireducens]